MDAAARVIRDVQVRLDSVDIRLGAVEERVRPGATITDTQATEVSSQVKVMAELLTGKDASKNQYQAICAEFYRRFGVSSYKLIPSRDTRRFWRFPMTGAPARAALHDG